MEGNDPEPFGEKNMTQDEAVRRVMDFLKEEPVLSSIPSGISMEKLKVRHGGYDIGGVMRDPNVSFPLERFRELVDEGIVGEMHSEAYSFVGACSQTRLLKRTGPGWVEMFREKGIDAALLVPV